MGFKIVFAIWLFFLHNIFSLYYLLIFILGQPVQ